MARPTRGVRSGVHMCAARAALCLAAAALPMARAAALSLLVPAYFPPSGGECGGELGYWDCLISAAGTTPAMYDGGVVAIGPGNAHGEAVRRLRAAVDGARAHALSVAEAPDEAPRPPPRWGATVGRRRLEVVGRVAAEGGAAAVEEAGRAYRDAANVTGFLLDGCSPEASDIATLRSYAEALRALFAEPIALVCNFTGAPDEAVVAEGGLCNVSVVHDAACGAGGQALAPEWFSKYDRSRFAVVSRGCSTAAQMRGALAGIAAAPVGYAFVTDAAGDALPPYWPSELASLTRPWQRYAPSATSSSNPYVVGAVASVQGPRYLAVAQEAVGLLRGASNVYGRFDTHITLEPGNFSARTQCATFVTRLLQLTYNLTPSHFTRWFDSKSPWARTYHDAIVNGSGFVRIFSIEDVLPGDIFAVKYWDPAETNTGHVMIVVNIRKRAADKAPIVNGTAQYDVWVVDSSATYHGPSDTRRDPAPPGGIGMGIARLYADSASSYSAGELGGFVRGSLGANTTLPATGGIVGYTWSDFSNSKFYSHASDAMRTMVIGRPVLLEMFDAAPPEEKADSETQPPPQVQAAAKMSAENITHAVTSSARRREFFARALLLALSAWLVYACQSQGIRT